jgi:hypothetical protein
MSKKKPIMQFIFVALITFSFWTLLIPIVAFYHELGHAVISTLFNVKVYGLSMFQVVTEPVGDPLVSFAIRLAGGLFQALIAAIFFTCIDFEVKKWLSKLKKRWLIFLSLISFEIASITHVFIGGVNGVVEAVVPNFYSHIFNNILLWGLVSLLCAIISSYLLYTKRITALNDIWIFGYGSLIWDRSEIKTVKEKIGKLKGWHKDWTWISTRRYGAPTCSLQPRGSVKGIFMKLNPKTANTDLETLRKREKKSSEKVIENVNGIIGKIYFWTMGNNLSEHDDLRNLQGTDLYRALAERAISIKEKGPDGKTAIEYAFSVFAFDPDDQITKMYISEIEKITKQDMTDNSSEVIEVIKTRIESLKANRNFFAVLFTLESSILTVMFSYLSSKLVYLSISMVLISVSLVFALLGIFALTDSIHFYSKYLEYNYAWNGAVHGITYPDQSGAQKAIESLKRALEADDIGYYYLKLSLLLFTWFVASLIFVFPQETLTFEPRVAIFLIIAFIVSLLVILTYKCTHKKSLLKSFRDFLVRKPIF